MHFLFAIVVVVSAYVVSCNTSLFVTSPTGLTLLIFTYKAMCSIAQGSRMQLSDLVVCVYVQKKF